MTFAEMLRKTLKVERHPTKDCWVIKLITGHEFKLTPEDVEKLYWQLKEKGND